METRNITVKLRDGEMGAYLAIPDGKPVGAIIEAVKVALEHTAPELAADIGTDEQYAELKRVAPMMLDEWSETKTAPCHADWLHELARKEHGVS